MPECGWPTGSAGCFRPPRWVDCGWRRIRPSGPTRACSYAASALTSAHQIGVAALGLASLRWPRLRRSAASAAVAIDVADMLSAVVEAGERTELGADLAGGMIFSAIGAATAATALRELG